MIYILLAGLGLCFGSFVNALVWRLHEKNKKKSKNAKKNAHKKELSILNGRSMCPRCYHTLSAMDLIPIVSWIGLRGKCRYCHKKISLQYPLIELLTAVVFVFSYVFWPIGFGAMGLFNLVIWYVVAIGLMALLVYDLKWMLLPDRIVYPLVMLAAIGVVVNIAVFDGGLRMAGEVGLSLLVASGFFYAIYQYSKGTWIGGGDVKLGLLIGLVIARPMESFLVLFTASLLGTVTILPGLFSRKLKTTSRIPFGPYLIIATLIVKLFGGSIVAWYRSKFLLY